jgi:hypothetical protein
MKNIFFVISLLILISSCTSTGKKTAFSPIPVAYKTTAKMVTKKITSTTPVKTLVHKAETEKPRSVTLSPKKAVIEKTVKAPTPLIVVDKVLSVVDTPPVEVQNVTPVTPKQSQPVSATPLVENVPVLAQNLPPLPEKAVEELKRKENFPLATGKVEVSKNVDDEVGYGVTSAEVEDAVRAKLLTKGTMLPSNMTKDQADWWLVNITIPTYRKIVREIVTEEITLEEETALTFFVQNQGRENLKLLVNQEGRLNDGNHESIIKIMPLYYKQNRGLKARGAWQVSIITEGPSPRA